MGFILRAFGNIAMLDNFTGYNVRYKMFIINSIIFLLVTYFLFHSVYGDRGVIAYFKLSQKIEKSLSELDISRLERIELEHKVNLFRPQSLDTDALDELARKTLGILNQKEQVFVAESE